jgi:ankyrin repeat protein
MRVVISIVILFSISTLFSKTNDDNNRFKENKSGIPILFIADKDIVPPVKEKQNTKFVMLKQDDKRIPDAVEQISKGLSKYPNSLLKKTVYNIYVIESIITEKGEIGGFISWRPGNLYTIYISAKSDSIEATFHHEYSHAVWDKYKNYFDENTYVKLNPSGYQYGKFIYTNELKFKIFHMDTMSDEIEEEITNTLEDDIDEDGSQYGFITWYSEAYIYEDWAEYMEHMMMGTRKFWAMYDKHIAVKRKADFLMQIYNKIDPIFTIRHFKSFSKYTLSDQHASANIDLISASKDGNIEAARAALVRGADINMKTKYGNTALIIASGNGNPEMVKFLIKKGANINTKENNGNTALLNASHKGHLEIIKLLIENGAGIKTKNSYGNTALMFASDNGRLDIVKYLISKGSNVNEQNNYNVTVLMMASAKGNLEMVNFLIEKDADIYATSCEGWTSLLYASQAGCSQVIKLLIEKGVDVNEENENGCTALMTASYNGHLETVEYLIEQGADVNTKDNEGKSALTLAVQKGHKEIEKCLKSKGAN